MIFTRAHLFASLLILTLAGCQVLPSVESPCMKISLLSNVSRTPLYHIVEDDPRSATLGINKTECKSVQDARGSETSQIVIDVALTIPEARKTYSRTTMAIFPVFVALLDSEDNVLDRHDENIEVNITDKATNHVHKIIYHLPQGISADSKQHRLLIGFNGNIISRSSHLPSSPKDKQRLRNKKIDRL